MPIDIRYDKSVMTKYTEKLIANPLLVDFEKIGEEYYSGKIEKPIDLSKIKDKISNDEYKSFNDWYDDVVLLFDNTIEFYSDSSHKGMYDHFIKISQYFKQTIENDFKLRLDKDEETYYKLLSKYLNKYRKLLYKSPVIQCDDGIFSQIIKESKGLSSEMLDDISNIDHFFNPKLENPEIRRNVYKILEQTSPELKFDPKGTVEITVENLRQDTQNALLMYMNILNSSS